METIYKRNFETAPDALLVVDRSGYMTLVNDQAEHRSGFMAETLVATAGENDIVARHGGEEFVMAIQGINEAESLVAAERVRLAIAAITRTPRKITASIGIAAFTPELHKREATQILEEMLDQADRALYEAKNQGRNRVCHFNTLRSNVPG